VVSVLSLQKKIKNKKLSFINKIRKYNKKSLINAYEHAEYGQHHEIYIKRLQLEGFLILNIKNSVLQLSLQTNKGIVPPW